MNMRKKDEFVYATSIAVLMTCYNRRETTLECLESLFKAQVPKETTLSIYLVDDGSTDGTGDSVRERYPAVKVLNGAEVFIGAVG